MNRPNKIALLALIILVAFTALALWRTSRPAAPHIAVSHPAGIMGTNTMLAVVAPNSQTAEIALEAAEAALRRVEALMSVHLDASELSRLNTAGVGEEVELSRETREVLAAALAAWRDTQGAFDTTCGPLIVQWRKAAELERIPEEAELSNAKSLVGWRGFDLTERGAIKKLAGARLDLGGVAKGYAIDNALAAMQAAGAEGGLVDVGGDLRAFWQRAGAPPWSMEVRNPFGRAPLARLALARLAIAQAAVCTSGDYARFVEIQGRRFSHIIDPRTGWPADAVPSVTVIAPTAMEADIWATALSVLGPLGVDLLPAQVEALLVLGDENEKEYICSSGFPAWLHDPPPELTTLPRKSP